MLVMKFGGASVKHAEAIRNVAEIIQQYQDHACLIVISAAGKTTNHLETLSELARDGQEEEAMIQYRKIVDYHRDIARELFGEELQVVEDKLYVFFREIERVIKGILLLGEFSSRTYDRIVAFGELMSTTIIATYLEWKGSDSTWLDARRIVKTDATHKQARVIWSLTEENIRQDVAPLVKAGQLVVTQGFIASTLSDVTTTLGREGSDYTASIFAHGLDAEKLIVWKDVKGILNADPRIRKDTIKLDQLSYEEAVEMTFYGASVIHPKTIKPLFNKNIPLHVKCFNDIEAPGSRISKETQPTPIPSYIVKKNQAYVHIKPRDFSFMDEQLMEVVFNHIYKTGVKVNLVQNSAISLLLCMNETTALDSFESLLLDQFEVEIVRGLKLYTIMNFMIKDLKQTEGALMVQQNGNKLYFVKPS